jgi:uncharacterized membrane protein
MASLDEFLQRWRDAGLIDSPTADRIQAFERERHAQDDAGPDVLEVLVYLGAAIVTAGIAILASSAWGDLRDWSRVALLAIPAALALGAGAGLRSLGRPAFVRGGNVMWLVATVLAGAAAAVVADNAGAGESGVPLTFGVTSFTVGAALWSFAPSSPQVLGVTGSLVLISIGLGVRGDDARAAVTGLALAAFGTAMLSAGETRLFFPRETVRALGTLQTGIGAFVASFEHGAFEVLALAIAVGLVATAVSRRSLTILGGGVALFFFEVVSAIVRHVDNPNVAALALIVVGVALVACVFVIARSRPWQSAHQSSSGA